MSVWKATLLILAALGCVSCSSTRASLQMPVAVTGAERVTVLDFASEAPEVGAEFSDLLAMELQNESGHSEVSQNEELRDSIVISGRILKYRKGNVPARIKFGPAVGNAYLTVEVDVRDSESGEILATFVVDESTLWTGPDARRTGRENIEWVQRAVAREIVNRLSPPR